LAEIGRTNGADMQLLKEDEKFEGVANLQRRRMLTG